MKVFLYTDGSARLDPNMRGVKTPKGVRGQSGPGTWSYVIRAEDHATIIDRGGNYLEDTTVPEAELSAIIGGLFACSQKGVTDVTVRCDSQLVVMQANGVWKIRAAHLKDYYVEIATMAETFENFKIEWVPRTQNHLADQIGREITREREEIT